MPGMGEIIDFAGFDQPEHWTPHLQEVFDIVSPIVCFPWGPWGCISARRWG